MYKNTLNVAGRLFFSVMAAVGPALPGCYAPRQGQPTAQSCIDDKIGQDIHGLVQEVADKGSQNFIAYTYNGGRKFVEPSLNVDISILLGSFPFERSGKGIYVNITESGCTSVGYINVNSAKKAQTKGMLPEDMWGLTYDPNANTLFVIKGINGIRYVKHGDVWTREDFRADVYSEPKDFDQSRPVCSRNVSINEVEKWIALADEIKTKFK